jgi:hypothetical protein
VTRSGNPGAAIPTRNCSQSVMLDVSPTLHFLDRAGEVSEKHLPGQDDETRERKDTPWQTGDRHSDQSNHLRHQQHLIDLRIVCKDTTIPPAIEGRDQLRRLDLAHLSLLGGVSPARVMSTAPRRRPGNPIDPPIAGNATTGSAEVGLSSRLLPAPPGVVGGDDATAAGPRLERAARGQPVCHYARRS